MRSLQEYRKEERDEYAEDTAEEKARLRAAKRRWLHELRGDGPDGEGLRRDE